MPTESGGTRSRSGGMSVSLASPDGRVLWQETSMSRNQRSTTLQFQYLSLIQNPTSHRHQHSEEIVGVKRVKREKGKLSSDSGSEERKEREGESV